MVVSTSNKAADMTPGQQLQRLLADVPQFDPPAIASLLPLVAALQSALYVRILVLQHQAGVPDTDYLLNIDDVATRLSRSTRWVRDNIESLPFAFQVGPSHRFSARGLDEWIKEQRAIKMAQALPSQEGLT